MIVRREKYEARRKAMYERIERERREQDVKEEEPQRIEDDDLDEAAVGAHVVEREVSEDSKMEETSLDGNDANLPGMVSSMFEID